MPHSPDPEAASSIWPVVGSKRSGCRACRCASKLTRGRSQYRTAHDPGRPSSLKGHTISKWLNGTITSARPSHIAYVLKRWKALSDATTRSARAPAERVPLTEDILVVIDEFWDRGFLPDKILEGEEVPEGLNAAIIRTWKDRRIKTAAKDYLDFVFSECKSQ